MVITRSIKQVAKVSRDITVLQFNTLADAFAGEHFLNVKNPNILKWENRKDKLIQVISNDVLDVICLQEVDHYHDVFLPTMQILGYEGLFVKKASESSRDGIAMFYKTDRLTLVKKHEFTYTGQNQNGIIAVFDVSTSSGLQRAGVCVTHLKAKKEFADVREKEVHQLLQELATHAPKVPTIVCGDFNDEAGSSSYEGMVRGRFESAYKQAMGHEPPFTTFKDYQEGEKKRTIDYIFYTQPALALESVLEMIPDTALPNKLPCEDWPSDHLSLQASFAFTQGASL